MPVSWSRDIWDRSESDLLDSALKPLTERLDQAFQQYQQAATAPEPIPEPFRLPSPSDIFGAVQETATQAVDTATTAVRSVLPTPASIFGEDAPSRTPQTTPAPEVAAPRSSAPASGTPAAMPQGSPERSERISAEGAAAFSAGKSPEGQARVYQVARSLGRSDEDARILSAVTETEGGWAGGVGDQGQSRGIYQFHERGEMPAFRSWLAQQGIQGDPNQLAYDPDVATRFAATTYLGRALDEGRAQGLSGSALATYVQRHGQRSERPETTGANYERLFSNQGVSVPPSRPAPAAMPQQSAAAPSVGVPRVVPLATPNTSGKRQETVGMVIHSTNGGAATNEDEYAGTLRHFANPGSQVSANAVIAADGTVALMGDWDATSWHAGENNATRFGVELVQTARDNRAGVPFTDAQYRSLAWLTGQLSQRYGFPIDRNTLVGHQEVEQGKRSGKIDPGAHFDWNRYQQEARAVVAQPVAQTAGTSVGTAPSQTAPGGPTSGAVAPSPLDAARSGAQAQQPMMQRMALEQPADTPVEGGETDVPERRGRFTPSRNIVPLGPALAGVDVGPAYERPHMPNRAVPGMIDEWTEPVDAGEGLYPSGEQRNSAVAGAREDVIEMTPAQIAWERDAARDPWLTPPPNPGEGYEGRPLPAPVDATPSGGYPWTTNIPPVPQINEPGGGNQGLSYRQPLSQQPELPPDDGATYLGPGDGGTAPQVSSGNISPGGMLPNGPDAHYDPDQGPREATPGSVGAQNVQQYGPALSEAGPAVPASIAAPDTATAPPGSPYAGVVMPEAPADRFDSPEPTVTQQAIGAATTPAARVYGEAITEANTAQDEYIAARNAKMTEWGQAASVPHDQLNRAIRIVNSVLLATPEATADTIDAVLSTVGMGRETIGIDLPVVGRLGLADVVDVKGVSFLGMGNAARMAASPTVAGRITAAAVPSALAAAKSIEDATSAGMRAAGEAAAPIIQRGREAVQGVGERARGALSANAERVAAADARMAAEGSTVAPATMGAVPEPTRGRQTVEVLQEQLETATGAWRRARDAGDERMAALAREHAVDLESQLVDARNARLDLEPAITSDVGRRVESLPLAEETADTLTGAGSRPGAASAADLSGPVSVPPQSISLNAGLGVVPEGTPDRMRPRYAYRDPNGLNTPGTGLVKVGEERVIGREVDATRDVTLANADHLGAVRARTKAEAIALRRPDDPEAQQSLMDAVAAEERAKDTLDAAREWLQVVKTGDATFATTGTAPSAPGAGALGAFNRAASEVIVGGTGGATIEMGRNPDEDPRTAVARGFVAGAVGFPAATRLARGAARAAGRSADAGAGARISLGDVPPSQIRQSGLPGMEAPAPRAINEAAEEMQVPASLNTPPVQRALTGAQRRKENMERRGLAAPSVWDWIKQAGYAGIYGPATFTNAVLGGAQELLLGAPKEAIRALVDGRPGNYVAQVGSQVRAMPDGLAGLGRVLMGSDSAATAAASGGSQGTANLSERVANPVGHFAARMLERPGELLTEAPDAVLRPMFLAQGMQREAGRLAAEIGLRGPRASAYADELMKAAEALRANPDAVVASDAAHRIVAAGKEYADRLSYKGDAGGLGRWLGQLSRRDDPIGVLAAFLTPFPGMVGRMTTAAAQSTPGVGLLPAVRRGQATKFDVVYDQAFGTAVAAGVAYWAFNGGVTGSGPSDPEKRKMMIDQGWQPNSYMAGGHYIPNRTAGRFQPILDTAGELHDALAYRKADQKPSEMVAELVKRGSKIATDQVGLSGMADLHDMMTQGFASQFPGWATRSGLRYVPYAGVMRGAANALDDKQRKPEGWGDEVFPASAIGQQARMALPGLRQSVPVAQDTLGREAPNPQQGLGALAPRVTAQRNDPVIRLFQDTGVDIGKPNDQMMVGRRTPVALKPAEQRTWNTHRGQFIQDYADAYTGNPDFMALPPKQKERYLQAFLTKAADYADKMLQSEMDPDDLTNRAIESATKKAS